MNPEDGTDRIRAVINTDILISGILSAGGSPGEIVDLWLAGEFTLLASNQMLAECERILEHPTLQENLRLAAVPKDDLMAMLRDRSERTVEPRSNLSSLIRNPFEEMVLASAVAGHADYLVTEEEDLLALGEYEGVTIISPEQFVQIMKHLQGRLL